MHGQPFLCFDKYEYTYCRNCSKIDGCWVEDRQKYPMNNPAGVGGLRCHLLMSE